MLKIEAFLGIFLFHFAAIATEIPEIPEITVQDLQSEEEKVHDALINGTNLAARYYSPQCIAARNTVKKKHLQTNVQRPMNVNDLFVFPDPVLSKHFNQTPFGDKIERAVYIRNPKVASSMLMDGDKFLYSGTKGGHREGTSPFTWNEVHVAKPSEGKFQCLKGDLFFTVVREPLPYFIAGWLETRCKYTEHQEINPEEVDVNKEFIKFLDNIENLKPIHRDVYHVWPQSLKIDSIPNNCQFSYIGESSDLKTTLKALFPTGRLPPPSHTAVSSSCKQTTRDSLDLSKELIQRVCRYLHADYACFGYPLPKECS